MESLFEVLAGRLLATSVQTALLVALVWALCRGVRRLPAATQCGLWWLVALQAVVGLVWANPLELPLLPAAAPAVAAVAASGDILVVPATTMTVAPAAAGGLAWPQALLALWLAGVLAMAVRTTRSWRASRQQVRASQPCRDDKLIAALRMAAEAHGLREAPRLRISAQIDSPQLVGPWRPVLLLPARQMQSMAADDLDMALTHELVHLQRRDLWWGLLPALAQHLFFFHPLVHLAAREYALAREAAVDAAVVAGSRHCRHDYGRLLLQLGVAPRPCAGLASASPTFLSLKRRLLMLQNTSPFPRLGAGLILAAVALVGVMPLRLVAMPAPPAPPAAPSAVPAPAPAPQAAPAPPAPAAVTAPPPPPAPVAPEAPIAPRLAPIAVQGRITLSKDSGPNAYVLLQDRHNLMSGSSDDLRQARQLDDGDGLLWIRRGDQRYVVRDAATLARFQELYRDSFRLGEAQGELGGRQGTLGKRQGELGRRMGEAGARIAAAAAEQARVAMLQGTAERSAAQEAARADARKAAEQAREAMREQGVQDEMRELARQQAELAKRQAEIARQQATASARAEREAERLIRQAIADGIARPIKG